MVGATGFEPATPSSQARCAAKLRYAPITIKYIILTHAVSVNLPVSHAGLHKAAKSCVKHVRQFIMHMYKSVLKRCQSASHFIFIHLTDELYRPDPNVELAGNVSGSVSLCKALSNLLRRRIAIRRRYRGERRRL